jgi:Lon protease-like protein
LVTLAERYRGPSDLPQPIAVFPLRRSILLPRVSLPLQVFEPRYLAMIDDVMAGSRLVVIVQPAGGEGESPPGKSVELRRVGCVGRITAYQEFDDGRLAVSLSGIARCALADEVGTDRPYRLWNLSFDRYPADFRPADEASVDREGLLSALKRYLEVHQMRVDWTVISNASNEWLVNSLSLAAPYGPEEKQALIEAPDLKARADLLVALAEMDLAAGTSGTSSALQ